MVSLSSCTVLPPLDCVPLHSLYAHTVLSSYTLLPPSTLCRCTLSTLHSALSTLHSEPSTLYSRTLCAVDPLLLSLYSRLGILVVCIFTLHSHTFCTLDSTFSWSALCLCTHLTITLFKWTFLKINHFHSRSSCVQPNTNTMALPYKVYAGPS